MVTRVKIDGVSVGAGERCFIMAEAGVNHNGNLDCALELVRMAKSAGADCIKFQTFSAGRVATKFAPKAEYQLQNTDRMESQYTMLSRLELSEEDHRRVFDLCRELGIVFLSTPYSYEDAQMLYDLGVGGFKIASAQIVETSLLYQIAKFNRPMILSTGMATMSEIGSAVESVLASGNKELVLLQCTTNYPSIVEDANLRAMDTLRDAFKVPVGYSDHTLGSVVSFAAAARGASIIEKHFTLSRTMEGPDHSSSCEPNELDAIVVGIREIESSLGTGIKLPTERELENLRGMRRSIVAKHSLVAGTILTEGNLSFKRPATGLSPAVISLVVGRRIARNLVTDEPIDIGDLR